MFLFGTFIFKLLLTFLCIGELVGKVTKTTYSKGVKHEIKQGILGF